MDDERKAIDMVDQAIIGGSEERLKNKDLSSVLSCLFYCLSAQPKIEIPNWCADAFCSAYRKVAECQSGSWDDVFGRPHPKGTHLEKERDLYKNRMAVFRRVEELRESGVSVDGTLFERVGRELGIGGKTVVESHYYYVKSVEKKYPRWRK